MKVDTLGKPLASFSDVNSDGRKDAVLCFDTYTAAHNGDIYEGQTSLKVTGLSTKGVSWSATGAVTVTQ